ncbi:hypothetical protein DCAR_0626466 [Daucus carota subsp. sativus]|uniref:Uncharacterized protein n=1 Tax=Daucus carota subsp. sativus TaxID=79200 RepID=A0A161WVK9_DAUCS|nr:hypothetical protein DCAR_0626466 [Daucus carota subsp. sativus]
MASTQSSDLVEADTIYRQHKNILDLIPVVQNHEFSISIQPAKSLHSFSLFRRGCHERFISFVIMGVLKALEYIHARENRVHGNINLNTVFLDEDCEVKLELPVRRNCEDEEQKADIRMVGGLALCLFNDEYRDKFVRDRLVLGCFYGKTRRKELLTGSAVRDFAKFCLYQSHTPTLREVINHEFFKKFGEFDLYQVELKNLLHKKLGKK